MTPLQTRTRGTPPGAIIFLDVDGVLIPGRSYIAHDTASPPPDPLGAGIVRRLCRRHRAQIVWNTPWSHFPKRLDQLAREAELVEFLIQIPRAARSTRYPTTHRTRLGAIRTWLEEHAPADCLWIALDDAPIDHSNAIAVHPMNGISIDNYRAATILLGNPDKAIIEF